MSYVIFAFDGLAIPVYNPAHNMGTGRANVSFRQLPGGGYYDNYGSSKSSQGIRPIIARGTATGANAAAMKTVIDNLRQKIGVRGKLTVKFDDGSLRWQWARLVDVDTPPDIFQRLRQDFDLQFMTAAQHWYGVITTENEWSWGDLSWTFGDGTAELGENGETYTLTATGGEITGLTVDTLGTQYVVGTGDGESKPNNGGNINATNMIITVTAVTNTVEEIHWSNATSGYSWAYELNLISGNSLTIDTGAMSIKEGSTNRYSNFTPSDKSVWDVLAPGDNTITVTVKGNAAQDATLAIEFYDHYA